MNYKEIIQEGIPLIQEWINKQDENTKQEEDFKELVRVITEIEQEQDFSKQSYEDIQFVLRPFEDQLSLKIKRIFNISMMDQYTMFIASKYFDSIEDHINLMK